MYVYLCEGKIDALMFVCVSVLCVCVCEREICLLDKESERERECERQCVYVTLRVVFGLFSSGEIKLHFLSLKARSPVTTLC